MYRGLVARRSGRSHSAGNDNSPSISLHSKLEKAALPDFTEASGFLITSGDINLNNDTKKTFQRKINKLIKTIELKIFSYFLVLMDGDPAGVHRTQFLLCL